MGPSICTIRTSSPTSNTSSSSWVRADHSSWPSLIRPAVLSTRWLTNAVRPTKTATPSICSGVRSTRCRLATGRTTTSSAAETTTNAMSCSTTLSLTSATLIPPSAPPANMSNTRSRLATSPAAKRPAAINQSNQAATVRSLARQRPFQPFSGTAAACAAGRPGAGGGGVVASSVVHDIAAGRVAVWATAWLTGRTSYDAALDALLGDTAHRVVGLPGTDEAVPLGWALTALRGLGERRLRLVLPVPGDTRGLPPVPALVAAALESGQAAVGGRLALVPDELGPEVVSWTAFDLAGTAPVAPLAEGNLRAVSGELDLAVGDAAR